jgi:hypothetical protein
MPRDERAQLAWELHNDARWADFYGEHDAAELAALARRRQHLWMNDGAGTSLRKQPSATVDERHRTASREANRRRKLG